MNELRDQRIPLGKADNERTNLYESLSEKTLVPSDNGKGKDIQFMSNDEIKNQLNLKGATDPQLELFRRICVNTGLNAFMGEIEAWVQSSQIKVNIPYTTYFKKASDNPRFKNIRFKFDNAMEPTWCSCILTIQSYDLETKNWFDKECMVTLLMKEWNRAKVGAQAWIDRPCFMLMKQTAKMAFRWYMGDMFKDFDTMDKHFGAYENEDEKIDKQEGMDARVQAITQEREKVQKEVWPGHDVKIAVDKNVMPPDEVELWNNIKRYYRGLGFKYSDDILENIKFIDVQFKAPPLIDKNFLMAANKYFSSEIVKKVKIESDLAWGELRAYLYDELGYELGKDKKEIVGFLHDYGIIIAIDSRKSIVEKALKDIKEAYSKGIILKYDDLDNEIVGNKKVEVKEEPEKEEPEKETDNGNQNVKELRDKIFDWFSEVGLEYENSSQAEMKRIFEKSFQITINRNGVSYERLTNAYKQAMDIYLHKVERFKSESDSNNDSEETKREKTEHIRELLRELNLPTIDDFIQKKIRLYGSRDAVIRKLEVMTTNNNS